MDQGQLKPTEKATPPARRRKAPASRKRPAQSPKAGPPDASSPFASCWGVASSSFEFLQREMFSSVLSAVSDFALSAPAASSSSSSSSSACIPTCALLTGVNLPDHEALFGLLASSLRASVTPHVARLRASGAPHGQSQRALVRSAVGQLTCADEDDDVRRSDLVFPALEAWYANQYPSGAVRAAHPARAALASPRKRRRPSGDAAYGDRPPLVIVLEDFEGFQSQMLQDFVLNLA